MSLVGVSTCYNCSMHYELRCRLCGVFFDLGSAEPIKIKNVQCVECTSRSIEVLTFYENLAVHLYELETKMSMLQDRVDELLEVEEELQN